MIEDPAIQSSIPPAVAISPGPAVDRAGQTARDPSDNVIDLVKTIVSRQDDLRHMESSHLREIMQLRDSYEEKIRRAETDRIDAIRAVDVGAVHRAAEVSSAQAATLAQQVVVSAEALRNQVDAAAKAQSEALSAALEPIQKDVADLRRAQYEQQGQKTAVTEVRDTGLAARTAMIAFIGILITIGGVIIAILSAKG